MVCPSRPLVRSARLRSVLLVSSSVLFSALLSLSQAQVTLDGSLGPRAVADRAGLPHRCGRRANPWPEPVS